MNANVARYVLYRFRTTFSRRRGGYLTLILLIGLLGGTAMASLAAGRRTQSSFPAFLAATHPSDLVASVFDITSATGTPSRYSTVLAAKVAHIPGVTRLKTAIGLNAVPLHADGSPTLNAATTVVSLGSVNGLYFDADRPGVVRGRMPARDRANEFVMGVAAARLLGLHLGQTVPIGFYTNTAVESQNFGSRSVRPLLQMKMQLVGLVEFNTEVVQDDVDRLLPPVLFTPALTRRVVAASPDATGATQFGMALSAGSRGVAAAEHDFLNLLPPGSGDAFHVTSFVTSKVEAAVKPESIALGVFGAITGLAALLIAGLVIARQLRADDEALSVLRALGADPAMTALDAVPGVVGSVVVGALFGAVLAIGLSALAPFGPVRAVYPSRGIAADWLVIGPGIAVFAGVLGLTAVLLGRRSAPHRVLARSLSASQRPSAVSRFAANSGLPLPAVIGVRFALEPGSGRTAIPVRSAIIAATLGVAVVVATLTFGSGLRTLVSRPALYGWDWSYVLSSTNVVPPQALTRLNKQPDVAAWSGYYESALNLDGHYVPAMLGGLRASVTPPVLSGHRVEADNQIVVGPATLAELHKQVGDTVVATYGLPRDSPVYIPPTRLHIVGSVSLPAISKPIAAQDHVTLGRGAVVSTNLLPPSFRALLLNPNPTLNGPELALVRLRPGIASSTGLVDMRRIADSANRAFGALPAGGIGNHVVVLPVERPAQIANYKSMGATPLLLAAGLAAGVVVMLGFLTSTSVRRRRHDLAVLKALGFTHRQFAVTVACQVTVTAIIGVAAGLPLGIAAGRRLWVLFARQISVVPDATIPWTSLFVVVVGAVGFANLVAAWPGRSAARASTTAMLRSE